MDQHPTPAPRRLSRETRLLIVTISVSAIVLVVLAQFRFPAAPPALPLPTTPLERLAARATYDDLAGIVGRLERTIAGSLVVLRVAPRGDAAPRRISDLLAPVEGSQDAVRYVPALRISATTALAAIGGSIRISGIVGQTDTSATAGIIATDAIRRVALVRVPEGLASTVPLLPLADLQTPVYVVAVEGTRAGVTLRPIFLGRADRFGDPRWDRPLLALSGPIAAPGALIFSLDGRFIGCVVSDGDSVSIAGARDVIDTVSLLAAGAAVPGDAGIAVQPLTPPLAAATKTPAGVVVSEVRPGGPADGVLEVGDVITAVDGEPYESPDPLLLRIARGAPGSEVPLLVSRNGEVRAVVVTLAPASTVPPPSGAAGLLDLEYRRGTGSAVRGVAPGTPAALAGLRADDVIVRIGGLQAPAPAQVQSVVRQLAPEEYVLITVQRDGRQQVLAMHAPPADDAATGPP